MSNKTDLQTLNAKYSELIEELRGKAVGGGSGGGKPTVTVTVRGNYTNYVYYLDESGQERTITSNGQTVEAFGGLIATKHNGNCRLDCSNGSIYGLNLGMTNTRAVICLKDGTIIDTYPGASGGSAN